MNLIHTADTANNRYSTHPLVEKKIVVLHITLCGKVSQ